MRFRVRSELFKRNILFATVLLIVVALGPKIATAVIDQALTSEIGRWLTLLFLLGSGVVFMYSMSKKIDELHSQLDLRMRYIPVDDEADGVARLFEESRQIVRLAEREVLALNSFSEEQVHPAEKDSGPRRKYFEELIETSRRVNYRRLIQVEESDLPLSTRFDHIYIEHFKAMIEERDIRARQHPHSTKLIQLDRVSRKYPSTFLIVDDRYLVWQLSEVNPDARSDSSEPRLQMRAIVVVTDPRGHFITDFQNTFTRAFEQPRKSVEMKDLEPSDSL